MYSATGEMDRKGESRIREGKKARGIEEHQRRFRRRKAEV